MFEMKFFDRRKGYYCSTRVSSFIPMLLSIVMTLIISVNGFVKFFIQSVKPVEDEIFVYGLLLSLLVLSILYYAYRYFKPVKEFKYIVLNNFTDRLYIKNRVACALYLFFFYTLMIALILCASYYFKCGVTGLMDMILRLVAISILFGAFLSLNEFNNYYSYYSGKLE